MDGDGEAEVVTVGSDTLVHCISRAGKKKWTRSIGDEAAGLVVARGRIAAASLTGDLHYLDGRGERRWRRSLGSPCVALAAAGRLLCAATEDAALTWVNRAGKVKARAQSNARPAHLLGMPGGDLLLADAGGGLTLFAAPA